MEDPSPYLENSWTLKKDFFLEYDGKLTVNTRCVGVHEPEYEVLYTLTQDALFTFGANPSVSYKEADTCCIAFFRGSTCDANAEEPQKVCQSLGSGKMDFDAKAWQVYNCKGLWEEQAT